MISEKTDYGTIDGSKRAGLSYTVFAKNFSSIVEKEDAIVLDIINRGYTIKDRKLYYYGGGVKRGAETYINLGEGKYVHEEYEYVEHGIWKLKYKIKN